MNLLADIPHGDMRWPHLQRVAARWWRRWAYALTACLLGVLLMELAQPEVRGNHAQAEEAVARLAQQLTNLTVTAAKPSNHALASDVQGRLASLPAITRDGQIWTDWQQVLAAHGLRLQSMRPLAPESVALPKSAKGGDSQRNHLSHQAATFRLQGRFEDWSRAWSACAETGPLCTIDRINVTALEQAAEVQIDLVMRLWMRPAEVGGTAEHNRGDEGTGLQARQAIWQMPSSGGAQVRTGPALFAVNVATARSWGGAAAGVGNLTPSTDAVAAGTSMTTARHEDLPPDPRHWPLVRVRWVGLWQQGGDQYAILSAGPHGAKVRLGQRVTQEGHRLVAIAENGVSLRLAREPIIKLDGMRPAADGHSMGSEKR